MVLPSTRRAPTKKRCQQRTLVEHGGGAMVVTDSNGARKRAPFDDAFKKEDDVRTPSSSTCAG
jgi:hypothetical protein